jgi:hypothetical protein
MSRIPESQQVMAAQPAETIPAPKPVKAFPKSPQEINSVKAAEIVKKVKEEMCFFTHKSTQISHTVWKCILSQIAKAEEMIKRNHCRNCWQHGHTSDECQVKIVPQCDHCQKIGHWKPFCGAYLQSVYQTLRSKYEKDQQGKPTSSTASADIQETEEQYAARMTNEAQHASRIQASQAPLAHFSLLSGVPLGLAPQAIPNVFSQ